MKRIGINGIVVIPMVMFLSTTLWSQELQEKKPRFFRRTPIFTHIKGIRLPSQIKVDHLGRIFALDGKGARLYRINPEDQKIKIIGPDLGRNHFFDHPDRFDFDNKGNIYVLDGNLLTIFVINARGQYQYEILLSKMKSATMLLIDRKQRLLMNQPRLGHVINVYTLDGKPRAAFGELLSMEKAYPEHGKGRKMKVPMSRAWLTEDDQGNIYVAYVFAPIIQKYSSTGELLIETRLKGPIFNKMIHDFWNEPRMHSVANYDGIQMMVINQWITYDPMHRRLLLLLGNGQIALLDRSGHLQAVLSEKKGQGQRFFPLDSITVAPDGAIYGSAWDGFYRITFE